MTFSFALTSTPDGPAAPRTGQLTTAHGVARTPAFMPVGTLATVKSLLPEEVAATGAGILLVNAYHLYLRPGHERIAALGGVHRFMDWAGPILSDSGGFQVFSLATLRKLDEQGVTFRSHIDGSEHRYTPELAVDVQRALGVDIAMPLDHVLGGEASEEDARDAAARTTRWYERSRAAAEPLTLFAIVQGGAYPLLRQEHAAQLASLQPPGYAIGGLSVGESKAEMAAALEATTAALPIDRPRYLMGVGSPEDLVAGIALGVDMFDCVLPTRLGRTGALFTPEGRLNIRNAAYRDDVAPIDGRCVCVACRRFSRAYLAHLFHNEELLGYRLASVHNLQFLARLTSDAAAAIEAGAFASWAADFLARYRPVDEAVRVEQRERWRSRR